MSRTSELAACGGHAQGRDADERQGKRIQSVAVRAFQQLALEGRERLLAADARRRGNRKAERRHSNAALTAADRADSLLVSAGALIG